MTGIMGFAALGTEPTPKEPRHELSAAGVEYLKGVDASKLSGIDAGRLRSRRQQLTDRASGALVDEVLATHDKATAERRTPPPAPPPPRTAAEMAASMERGRERARTERERKAAQRPFMDGLTPLREPEVS